MNTIRGQVLSRPQTGRESTVGNKLISRDTFRVNLSPWT